MDSACLKKISNTLTNYCAALAELKTLNVITNKKDFTCQIGEWLVETIYGGKRAISGIQKGWDVEVKGKRIQVKTHAKAETNKAQYSVINESTLEEADELIIIIFTFNYKLKAFYKLSCTEALHRSKLRGKKNPRNEINWSDIQEFKIPKERLPFQELISLF